MTKADVQSWLDEQLTRFIGRLVEYRDAIRRLDSETLRRLLALGQQAKDASD